jgi:hypothetical protein
MHNGIIAFFVLLASVPCALVSGYIGLALVERRWLVPFTFGIVGLVSAAALPTFCFLWLAFSLFSESADASFCGSATRYGGPEDIRIVPVVIAPFELCNIQRQVFAADFVEASHDAPLQQRPKAIDRLCMNRAIDILASAMPDSPVFLQFAISGIFIGRDKADFFRNGFTDEAVQGFGIRMCDDASHDIAIALDGAHNSVLAFSAGPWSALIPMPVPVLSADVGFINFDNANQFTEIWIGEPGTNTMAHVMGSSIRTETEHSLHLQCSYAFLASQHEIDDFEPRSERNIRVFENRADQDGKAISFRRTSWAFPFEWHSLQCIDAVTCTVWTTNNAIWPAPRYKVRFASVIVGKQPIELRGGHLFGEFRGGHGSDLRV